MIDVEIEVFDACARLVLSEYPKATVSSVVTMAPASFPAVSIVETGNYVDASRITNSGTEEAAIVTYEVRVYSNLRQGAKTQAKKMAQLVDGWMTEHNLRRTSRDQGQSISDPSIYQVTSRYVAGVDRTGKLYRR